MTRQIRPILIATALLLVATPAFAQKKQLTRRPAGAGTVYGPVYGDTRTANRGDDDDDDRYENRGRRGDDREYDRDDDHDEDHDGPGRNGRGHAYGLYKNKDRKGAKCFDRNYDSICDDAQRGQTRNDCAYDARTGRCDVYPSGTGYPSRVGYPTGAGYPSTLPDMIGAVIASRGQRSADVTRWIGGQPLSVRTVRARNGRTAQASWFDPSGTIVQRWIDRDLDGRADAVQIFRGGRLARTLTR